MTGAGLAGLVVEGGHFPGQQVSMAGRNKSILHLFTRFRWLQRQLRAQAGLCLKHWASAGGRGLGVVVGHRPGQQSSMIVFFAEDLQLLTRLFFEQLHLFAKEGCDLKHALPSSGVVVVVVEGHNPGQQASTAG